MNAEEFEQAVGRPPVEDDLERVNCHKAGWAGHHQCGVCSEHGKPRFVCMCLHYVHESHQPPDRKGEQLHLV